METIDKIYKDLFYNKPEAWDYYNKNGVRFEYPFDKSNVHTHCNEFISKF